MYCQILQVAKCTQMQLLLKNKHVECIFKRPTLTQLRGGLMCSIEPQQVSLCGCRVIDGWCIAWWVTSTCVRCEAVTVELRAVPAPAPSPSRYLRDDEQSNVEGVFAHTMFMGSAFDRNVATYTRYVANSPCCKSKVGLFCHFVSLHRRPTFLAYAQVCSFLTW